MLPLMEKEELSMKSTHPLNFGFTPKGLCSVQGERMARRDMVRRNSLGK